MENRLFMKWLEELGIMLKMQMLPVNKTQLRILQHYIICAYCILHAVHCGALG